MGDEPYVVVFFKDDGLEVIRKEWAVTENGRIVASYFPPNVTAIELKKLLSSKISPVFEKSEWCNIDGKPYTISNVLDTAKTVELANKKLEIHIQLSEVDSDEGKIAEKLKRSRHSRCIKKPTEILNSDKKESQKRKPFSNITNSLWRPAKVGNNVRDDNNENPEGETLDGNTLHDDSLHNEPPEDNSGGEKASNSSPAEVLSQEGVNRLETISNNAARELKLKSLQQSANSVHISHQPEPVPGTSRTVEITDETNGSVDEVLRVNTYQHHGNPVNTVNQLGDTSRPVRSENSRVDRSTKLILQSINEVKLMVRSRPGNVEGGTTEYVNFDNKDKDLEIFPAKNKQEVTAVEKKLKSQRFFSKVTNALALLGFSCNIYVTVNKMLNQLLDYKAGQIYSFQGRSGKKPPFKDLRLNKVIHRATNAMFENRKFTRREIDQATARWLNNCKGNDKRLQEKLERQRRREEEERLELEGSEEDSSSDVDADEEDTGNE